MSVCVCVCVCVCVWRVCVCVCVRACASVTPQEISRLLLALETYVIPSEFQNSLVYILILRIVLDIKRSSTNLFMYRLILNLAEDVIYVF